MNDPLAKYHCVVDGCNSNSTNSDFDDISFFPCPQDPARCQQWKEILGFVGTHQYASLTPQESFNLLKICSLHFNKSSLSMSGKFLLNNAVPSDALVPKLYDDEVIIKPEAFCETEYLEDPLVKASYQESVDSRVSSSSNSKSVTTFNLLSYQTRGAQKFLPEIAKSSVNLDMPVKKRLRFKDVDDIALLREVAGQNPFANPELWDIIRQNVFIITGKDFSLKTLKDHLSLLIKLWCENKKALKDGFAVLQYSEKDQLCQDIFDTMWLFKGKDKKKILTRLIESAAAKIKDKNEVVQEVIVESAPELIEVSLDHEYCSKLVKENIQNEINSKEYINDNSCDAASIASSSKEEQTHETTNVLCAVRSRKRKCNIQEQYKRVRIKLKRKDQALEAKKIAIEERKLALEEKKLELSEKKLALEEFEKTKILDILEQQRQNIQKMVERQDRIIETLLLRNGNKTI